MIVTAVKTLIMIAVVGMLAACKTQEFSSSPAPPPPAKSVSLPPLPMAALAALPPTNAPALKRKSIRAFSVPAATEPTTGISDRLGPNYGVVTRIPVTFEGGTKGWAVEITWPNWPSTNAYSVYRSTNLVDWTQAILASPDPGRKIIFYETEKAEFYRINPAFISTPH